MMPGHNGTPKMELQREGTFDRQLMMMAHTGNNLMGETMRSNSPLLAYTLRSQGLFMQANEDIRHENNQMMMIGGDSSQQYPPSPLCLNENSPHFDEAQQNFLVAETLRTQTDRDQFFIDDVD